jgi:tripartite-type tricarboxylate transporter receptor subunit TctC
MNNWLMAGVAIAVALFSGVLHAQTSWPARPVQMISPYVPGGTTDKDGRVWGQKMSEALGKPFVLDFKPGAGSTVGSAYVAKSPPDGYTLLVVTSGYSITAATYKDLSYDPLKDLLGVTMTIKRPTVLMVHPSMPMSNFEEYIAYARANPGKFNFGTSGAGGLYHLMGEWMHSETKTKVTFVNYKGASPMFVDLVAGRVNGSPASYFNALPFAKAGKVKVIAIMSKERLPYLPGIRTVAEQGIPEFDYTAWGGILAPAGVPAAVLSRLSAESAKYAKDAAVLAHYAQVNDGTVVVGASPAEFQKVLVTEITRWRKLVNENGIKPEVN